MDTRTSLNDSRKSILATLWIFATLNYLYCDIVGFMDSSLLAQYITGLVNGMHLSAGFLLGGSVLMEIPMSMILVSKVMKREPNRILNIVAGSIMTLVQCASILSSPPTMYYAFFSIVEVACTATIVFYASRWRTVEVAAPGGLFVD